MKRGPKPKAVTLSRRKASGNVIEKLSDNPTVENLKDAEVDVSLAELEDRVADVRDSWETDSLFEDAFEDLSAGKIDGDACKSTASHAVLFSSPATHASVTSLFNASAFPLTTGCTLLHVKRRLQTYHFCSIRNMHT